MTRAIFITLLLMIVFFAGCAPPSVGPKKICPGKQSAAQALQTLSSQAERVQSFKANGQCFATFYDDKGKRKKEEFTIKLWLNPESEIRLFGDIAFNARGLDIGSNKDEFWIGAKPKEIGNSFYWGLWNEQKEQTLLMLGPTLLLEALGIVDYNEQQRWSLSNEKGFDVLKEQIGQKAVKKVYISTCDYRTAKIEYFDDENKEAAVLELTKYKAFFDDVIIPKEIEITIAGTEGKDDSFRIVLKKLQPFEFTEDKRTVFFTRAKQPKGFKHIYKIVNGELIEQQ
jgi:hypothetical protein